MTSIRSVPHQPGSRFTFAVKRFWGGQRPGWKVVRVAGVFWSLPPGTLDYLSVDEIMQFAALADSKQRYSFNSVVECSSQGKTRDACKPGIYWTGQKAFQVGMCQDRCISTPFQWVDGDVTFTGIYVSFPDAPERDYYLATPKDVSMATFYKYLLFYKQHIGIHPVQEDWYYRNPLPYGRDRRLNRCSMMNFESTPTQLALEI
ncbi:hypothetical protein STRATTON_115 [Erwinia phage vB_EamM_Stratton]|uniref:Uncharacterized protein n=1 Tax=Erwinia phage vB_EamM_Stratton TaxID=1883378 RepID=A0A1B2IGY9_9CAUD|nr:hypothetical protein STRATTON_115 [Erwinia phage vB_EamM_Stratton]